MRDIRLAIVGTRKLACPGDRRHAAARIIKVINDLSPSVVISGGAIGVDDIAVGVARLLGYDEKDDALIIFRPTVHRFQGPGGYRERDARIAAECTHLLRLACCKSTTYGSGWTADEAERLGKLVVREQVCREPQP